MRNSLKVLALILVCIVLSNCERDTIPSEKSTKRSLDGIFGAIVQYDSISKINHNFKRLISDKFSSNHKKSAGNLTSEVYGFSIDTSKVQLLTADTYKSYTFNVEREQYDYKVLENYVLTIFNNGDYTQMLISYPVLISDFSASPDVENASVTYINDTGLLLKSDVQCPSTEQEIIGWDEGAGLCVPVNCTAGDQHTPEQAWECNGSSSQLPYYECTGGWVVTGCTTSGGGSSTGDEDANDDSPYGDGAGHTNPNPDPNEEIAIMPLFGDNGVQDRVNDNLSEDSPYEVDVSAILDSIASETVEDSTKIAAEKFLCIYKKMTTSATYKRLFTDIFGTNNDNINVSFKVTKDLQYLDPETNQFRRVNGLTGGKEPYVSPLTGKIEIFNAQIEIDQNLLNNFSNFSVLKTILHESIHAFIRFQLAKCDPNYVQGQFDGIQLVPESIVDDNVTDSLFVLFDDLCNGDMDQHELIFDYMLPVFSNVINEIGLSNLASQEDLDDFENDPNLNWADLHYYTSLQGLHKTEAFKLAIEGNTDKAIKYNRYLDQRQKLNDKCN